ncbi:hypothetical protein G3M48_004107 [Beauveria asiatica]|uniref:FAD-binding PCMH-type domain-containing protein n=1 Tax=Beauveria asiatica TaxID=1069075 RepID=A0AAW0RTU4_9HYPO
MRFRKLVPFLTALQLVHAVPSNRHADASFSCKCTPSESCWPTPAIWSKLNHTIDGRLFATVPLGSPCHGPSFDENKCASIKEQWRFAPIHANDPTSPMVPIFQNHTCDPFHLSSIPCNRSNLVEYYVNASKPMHVQEAVNFARDNNVRLVIKNTGHDFLGRSTGKHALGIWTHYLNETTVLPSYKGSTYSGPALKMGAGTQASQAYRDAHGAGYRVVGGSCPTVGLAGGYTQGGGHGVLTSAYGLGADNVLEWEVVTAAGKIVTATPTKNSDLYWALSGGGGGNWGAVLSMTVKVYPEGPMSGGVLSFNLEPNTTAESFWENVGLLLSGSTGLVDSGSSMIASITNSTVYAYIAGPNVDKKTLEDKMFYMTSRLNQSSISYNFTIDTDPSYYDYFNRYFGPLPDGIWPVDHLMGNKLLPRSAFQSASKIKKLREVAKSITSGNEWAISAVVVNAAASNKSSAVPANAVMPSWRNVLVQLTVYSNWDWKSNLEMSNRSDRLTNDIIPSLVALAPETGIYANEANYRQADWKKQFYGCTWGRLNDVKRKWDPSTVFYTPLSAGSQLWEDKDEL